MAISASGNKQFAHKKRKLTVKNLVAQTKKVATKIKAGKKV